MAAEREPLAARENGGRDFVTLGGGEDEQRVAGRFFERFEQGVEGCRREHVRLVDDVDLVCAVGGAELDALDDLAGVFDAGVRGGVHFDHIN